MTVYVWRRPKIESVAVKVIGYRHALRDDREFAKRYGRRHAHSIKAVLSQLADRYPKINVGIRTLAEDACVDPKTVGKVLDHAIECGWLKRPYKGAGTAPSRYELVLPSVGTNKASVGTNKASVGTNKASVGIVPTKEASKEAMEDEQQAAAENDAAVGAEPSVDDITDGVSKIFADNGYEVHRSALRAMVSKIGAGAVHGFFDESPESHRFMERVLNADNPVGFFVSCLPGEIATSA